MKENPYIKRFTEYMARDGREMLYPAVVGTIQSIAYPTFPKDETPSKRIKEIQMVLEALDVIEKSKIGG